MMLLPLMLLWLRAPLFFPPSLRWSLLVLFCLVAGHGPGAIEPDPASPASLTSPSEHAPTALDPTPPAAAASPSEPPDREREGTLLKNVRGRFTEVGRRWTFTVDEREVHYRVLENQALERVVKAIRQDVDDNHWAVHGTLTEFADDNYLLLQAVVRATQTDPETAN
ncbi:hypothetical protein [Roseimaritima sediminicola]|uniref:hypothetical protein n=1 Tax=Roseimaritima sediminicola TaxID=2662066 RepID=UPI001298296F|nr:hypothetical protein [Roseimaritima sediminicola]